MGFRDMFHPVFVAALEVLVVAFGLVLTLTWAKRLLSSTIVSVGKGTNDDETLNQNIQIYVWDTQETVAKKVKTAGDIAYARKIWWNGEKQKVLKMAEEAKAQEMKLKAVEGK